ncbi:hypothetical protein PV04_08812 [Phialophora macrospora]|uniref:Uncharacterized protein n=1 Tax=Phialophora macrospora TaxID=1851006 RepID=A0A0D2FA80_9EURO|nr:hypothetical protein PV04_08812 [Phialophora macrospora]
MLLLLLFFLLGCLPAILPWQHGTTGFAFAEPAPSSDFSANKTTSADAHTSTSTHSQSWPRDFDALLDDGAVNGVSTSTRPSIPLAFSLPPRSPLSPSRSFTIADYTCVGHQMYICQYPNWSGTCFWTEIYPSMYNHCMVIIAAGGWASLGPDAGIAVDLYRYVIVYVL